MVESAIQKLTVIWNSILTFDFIKICYMKIFAYMAKTWNLSILVTYLINDFFVSMNIV